MLLMRMIILSYNNNSGNATLIIFISTTTTTTMQLGAINYTSKILISMDSGYYLSHTGKIQFYLKYTS